MIIEDGVVVKEFAVLKGPLYLGKNTMVGNHSLLRESFIEANSLVGSYSEITRSYLGEGVKTHQNYIGDSVIGDYVEFGAGSKTANWRLDRQQVTMKIKDKEVTTGKEKMGAIIGERVKTGMNVALMPGVRIGKHSSIWPNLTVKKDIPANSMLKVE